jgi:hypothetical protein
LQAASEEHTGMTDNNNYINDDRYTSESALMQHTGVPHINA